MKIPYKSLLFTPYVLVLLGIACNVAVQLANGQHMPVLPPGGNCSLLNPHDAVHACMTQTTHLKFMADGIMSDRSIESLGDLFQDFANTIQVPAALAWLTLTIRDAFNEK